LLAPFSWHWYSGDAIFIVDWVYWLLMIAGIGWSALRWRRHLPHPGRPAQVAGILMFGYIAFNLGLSQRVEQASAAMLRSRGIEPALIVASPPPLAFWRRGIAWRSADQFGSGSYDLRHGLALNPVSQPLGLDDPRLAAARASEEHVRAFLVWSRMPIVVTVDGHAYLTDQRFYTVSPSPLAAEMRKMIRRSAFLIPLDNEGAST
jgi:inner membrane protein